MSGNSGYLTPDLLGSAGLYSDSVKANTAFSFVAGLTMAVDAELLERALNDLMPRFPQFYLRVEKSGESFIYAERTVPVRVNALQDRDMSCTEDGFGSESLFAVSVLHKTVVFDFHRALTDEKGVVPFIRAVLFRYLELDGYEVENDGSVITVDSDFHDIEADDAFVRLDDIPASRPVWYMEADAASIPSAPYQEKCMAVQVHIPLSKMKGDARLYTAMPSTIVSPFFSQALLDEYPEADVPGKYVISYIQVNLRQYFPTTTFRPFFVNLPLAYNRKLSEYPLATVLMSQKKLLEAQLKTDALAYNAQREMGVLEKILGQKTLQEKKAAMDRMLQGKSESATYSICNIGSVIMPESISQYITEFYPVVPPVLFPYSLSTINFKGELIVTISSSYLDGNVAAGFAGLLKENGIPAYISDRYLYSPLKYKPVL